MKKGQTDHISVFFDIYREVKYDIILQCGEVFFYGKLIHGFLDIKEGIFQPWCLISICVWNSSPLVEL